MEIRYIYLFFYLSIFLLAFISLYILFRIYYVKRLIRLADRINLHQKADLIPGNLKISSIRSSINPFSESKSRIFRRLKTDNHFSEPYDFKTLNLNLETRSLFKVYNRKYDKSDG